MQSGDKVINFSLATSESWKNSSGERQTKTEWHNVVVFNKGLISVIENYVSKGSKIYIEGQIETRSWEDQSGVKKYTTEVVMRPFRSELVMLDSKKNDAPSDIFAPAGNNFDDTEIPF